MPVPSSCLLLSCEKGGKLEWANAIRILQCTSPVRILVIYYYYLLNFLSAPAWSQVPAFCSQLYLMYQYSAWNIEGAQ